MSRRISDDDSYYNDKMSDNKQYNPRMSRKMLDNDQYNSRMLDNEQYKGGGTLVDCNPITFFAGECESTKGESSTNFSPRP